MQANNIEAEASGSHDGEYQLTKHEFSGLGGGKYSGTYDIYLLYLLLMLSFLIHKIFTLGVVARKKKKKKTSQGWVNRVKLNLYSGHYDQEL